MASTPLICHVCWPLKKGHVAPCEHAMAVYEQGRLAGTDVGTLRCRRCGESVDVRIHGAQPAPTPEAVERVVGAARETLVATAAQEAEQGRAHQHISQRLQAAFDAGQAAGAENERRRVFDMMAADIRTVTGLDWSPTEGRTLQWLLDQHKAAGVAQERKRCIRLVHDQAREPVVQTCAEEPFETGYNEAVADCERALRTDPATRPEEAKGERETYLAYRAEFYRSQVDSHAWHAAYEAGRNSVHPDDTAAVERIQRERDQWRESSQHHGREAMRLAGERDAEREQALEWAAKCGEADGEVTTFRVHVAALEARLQACRCTAGDCGPHGPRLIQTDTTWASGIEWVSVPKEQWDAATVQIRLADALAAAVAADHGEPDPACALCQAAAAYRAARCLNPTAQENDPMNATTPEHIMQFFAYTHLPEPLQAVSADFARLAENLVGRLPRNPERTVALRKLLEAKDAAVRAALAKD